MENILTTLLSTELGVINMGLFKYMQLYKKLLNHNELNILTAQRLEKEI